MAKFKKGEMPPVGKPINEEIARTYQERSAEARKENNTIRETVRRALEEKAGSGTPLTRREYLVLKAMNNHTKGRLTFKDLKDLQDLLGESVQNVNVEGTGFKIVINTKEDAQAVDAILNREQ